MKIFQGIKFNRQTVSVISGVLITALMISTIPMYNYFHKQDSTSETTISSSDLTSETDIVDVIATPDAQSSEVKPDPTVTSIVDKNTTVKGTVSNTNVTIKTINAAKKLPKFNSYQDILALLKSMGISYDGNYRGGVMIDDVMTASSAESKSTTAMAPEAKGALGGSDYSSTNTQVSGIDEGDIIKNDGKYLYIAKQNTVSIMDVFPALAMKKVSTISLGQNEIVTELYLKGNTLTLICSSYESKSIPVEPQTDPVSPASSTNSGTASVATSPNASSKMGASSVWMQQKQQTIIKVYDVTVKETPVLKRTLSFDGYLSSSREKDGRFYIVTNYQIMSFPEKYAEPADILPSYSDSAKASGDILIQAQSIEYCPENVSANYLMISCFDISTQEPAVVETILGAGNTTYMSNNALYIVQPYYRYTVQNSGTTSTSPSSKVAATSPGGNGTVTTVEGNTGTAVAEPFVAVSQEGTVVMKFSLVGKGVQFAVAGEVPGQVLNQYSMDEYGTTFRIATTKTGNSGSSNNLYNLNDQLQVIGKVENLAPGERIYAVRFVEKTGYIVTFRNMDPLFVIDLSNPTAPKVVGELKIPGFSNYLHPISSTLLLGIGQNTITTYTKDKDGNEIAVGSMQSGLKVSLFDVSDPKAPKELDSLAFGGPGSNTEAQYNPRAFVWWGSKATALFPAFLNGVDGSTGYDNNSNQKSGALAISVEGNKLVEKARLFPENTTYGYYGQSRVAYIDNVIYLSMNSIVYAYDATTLKEISRSNT